ncbi:MAG: hypothetical protein ACOYM7_08000 [Paludibacter sp.]
MKSTYLVQDQFSFTSDTDIKVMHVINQLFKNKFRFRLWYGDTETGESWSEEYDTIGTVGRSTGTVKIPLLIKRSNSYGGMAILTGSIIKIVNIETGFALYVHPKFNQKQFYTLYAEPVNSDFMNVLCEGNIYASNLTVARACKLADFMNGARHSK